MPKIQLSKLTSTFLTVKGQTQNGDENNCFPVALAIASGETLSVWEKALEEAGRIKGKGTKVPMAVEAAKALGYELKPLPTELGAEIRSKYKGVHSGLKGLTTHHPVRFSEAWVGITAILITAKHAAAVVNGVNHDWSVNNQLRVTSMWQLTKDGVPCVPDYGTPEVYQWKDPSEFEAPSDQAA